MKAVFLDRGSFPSNIRFDLPKGITRYEEYPFTPPEETPNRIRDADIILTNKTPLTAEHLQACQQLKLIQVTATGMNNVDLDYCQRHQIIVNNVTDYSVNSVPEHGFSLLLNLRRNMLQYLNDVKNNRWSQSQHFCFLDYPIHDLANSTLLIVGRGNIGQRMAQIGQVFGMQCVFAERKGADTIRDGYVAFEDGLKQADVVTLHCPLTPENQGLMGKREMALMKPTALLLNISRGGLVDELALIDALKSGDIAGAAMDVATQEPMPLEHPLTQLLDLPNFLLTPHIAWASHEAMQTLSDMAMAHIAEFLQGE